MHARRTLAAAALLLGAPAAALAAQEARWAVLHGADTVATETFTIGEPTWKGRLEIRKEPRPQLEEWSVVRTPEGPAALVEVTESEAPPSEREKPRVIQRARIIFKGDSVAIDAVTNGGLMTRLYATEAGAVPYMHLSVGLLQLAVTEAKRKAGSGATASVALFNLAGGQTAHADVTFDGDKATMQVGTVRFDLALADGATIRRAEIASQQLRAERLP
jgi:hypothetical protein